VRLVLAAGGRAHFVRADVSDEAQVGAMVRAGLDAFGALHCASNNAARGAGFRALTEIRREDWDRSLGVTLTGVWLCMKHEIPAMLASGGGAIVNIASVSGMRGEATQAAYSAAKGGVLALTKTAAAEWARRGIRVNALCPGGIRTPAIEAYFAHAPGIREATVAVHAMRRLGEPEEVAEAVAWLCSDRASFVTGHALVVDGGVLVNPHSQ
jgi:NAD(P)-dependent dehydrogenase (short-subunit alcohol dehydrogenase family)